MAHQLADKAEAAYQRGKEGAKLRAGHERKLQNWLMIGLVMAILRKPLAPIFSP